MLINFMPLIWLLLLQLPGRRFQTSSDPGWTHRLTLDRQGHVQLFWTPSPDMLTMELQVKTLGYVALGFSPGGGMSGADMIIAWVSQGHVYIQDRFAFNNSVPVLDASQDVVLLSGYENVTHTVIRFGRKWDTCDTLHDLRLAGDTVRLIWAYHPDDPSEQRLPYHGHLRRGVKSVFLQEPPSHVGVHPADADGIKVWELRARHTLLPNDDHTHYWCQIFKAPDLQHKHHMVAFQPIIQPGHESYVHHMVLYECHVADGDSSALWFEQHLKAQGAACYSPNMPHEWSFCLATNAWAWAVGSEGEVLPDHVGMPLGEQFGGATYFMLETHYDNPTLHQNLVDTSGIRILYTDKLRPYDTAMLLVGSEVNFLHVIPPRQELFSSMGRCSQGCTRHGLRPEGIHIISGVLHSHLAGRQMKLRHIRNGKELPVILQDSHYDFNFQASRRPANETTVLPGDELIMECRYRTLDRNKPTFGGLATRDEMCLAFLLYYPRNDLADCRSLPTLETVMTAFGIQAIVGQSFQKLVDFLKDIGADSDSDSGSLEQLLKVLASETGIRMPSLPAKAPLTEEDILRQPFYAVVQDPDDNDQDSSISIMSESNYRTLLSDMLLSIRIQSPEELLNRTVGEHLAQMDWKDPVFVRSLERALNQGPHNTLCLAHGRKPLIPYEAKPYPQFEELNPEQHSADRCPSMKIHKQPESGARPQDSRSSWPWSTSAGSSLLAHLRCIQMVTAAMVWSLLLVA